MKTKTTTLFLILFINLFCSQNKKFIYEYKFITDSTNRENIKTEMMILNIEKEKSLFFGYQKFASDSTLLADKEKGIFSMPPNKEMINYRIEKHKNENKIKFITFVSNSIYQVTENKEMNWKLLPEFSKILNYKVQKAKTYFAGRKWIAWFTEDIPINDGPYKFRGLPGLILKISDESNSHIFEIKGIKDNMNEFNYPDIKNYSNNTEINYIQYVKIYNNYRQNPIADLIGQIPDQRDAEGNFKSSQQILREIDTVRKAQINKENNILEIDIIKNKK